MSNYKKQGAAWTVTEQFFNKFVTNSNTTWFISYPRTGSHWLRLMLESYIERPILRRTFFYPKKSNPLFIHEHDRTGEGHIKPADVLFLYRNPVDTVFSLGNYWKCFYVHESDEDAARYTRDYMIHLRKWLVNDTFTKRKTVVRYEHLRDKPEETFTKVLDHFGEKFNKEKFEQVKAKITKEEVKKSTQELDNSIFKNRVIAPEQDYETRRQKFWDEKAVVVWKTLKEDPEICKWFEEVE